MSVQKIIQESIGQNPLGLKEALTEELRARVALALEAKMKESDEEEDDDMEDEEAEMDDEEMDDEEDDDKLDELNKSTLASYVKKAATSSTIAGNTMGSSRDNKEKNIAAKTIGKRLQGIHRATNKLAKQ